VPFGDVCASDQRTFNWSLADRYAHTNDYKNEGGQADQRDDKSLEWCGRVESHMAKCGTPQDKPTKAKEPVFDQSEKDEVQNRIHVGPSRIERRVKCRRLQKR
jgi:hypothetical protein